MLQEMNPLTFAINLQQIWPLKSLFKGKKKGQTSTYFVIKILNIKLWPYLKSKEVIREVPVVYDGRVQALQKNNTLLLLFHFIF